MLLHYAKIPKLILKDLDWLFKLKTHWVAEESKMLICETYTKTKLLFLYTVKKHFLYTVNIFVYC